MFKLAGALIIFASSTIWGFEKAAVPMKRYKNLAKIISVLNAVKNEIRFTSEFIDDIFLKASKITDFDCIFKTAADYEKNIAISERWKKAVSEDFSQLSLSKEDFEALLMFGAELGMTDREGQIKNIENTITILDALKQSARDDYEKTAKLNRGLGIALGLTAIILLY